MLLDSGAQYEDGTTDVTRTIHLENATNKQVHNVAEPITLSHHNFATRVFLINPIFYVYYLTLYQIDVYTRVLMGHIDLASMVFPVGTPGSAIDAVARRHLWDAGLDYPHGMC